MKVGLVVPLFRDEVETAVGVARRAEAAGLDGVFAFDHLWPMGSPDRPALNGVTALGALAAETSRVAVGTLVARVSLLADAVLVHELETIDRVSGGRLVAGLGTGDRLSEPENRAYGIGFPPLEARLAQLADCARRLRDAGVTTWVGGRSRAVEAVAAGADALNLWAVDADRVAAARSRLPAEVEVTWGGQVLLGADADAVAERSAAGPPRPGVVAGTPGAVASSLAALAEAGATWAVAALVGPEATGDQVELLAEAAQALR